MPSSLLHFRLPLWMLVATMIHGPAALAVMQDVYKGTCVDILDVSEIVTDAMTVPPTEDPIFSDGMIPAHFQYTFYLDQAFPSVMKGGRKSLFVMEESTVILSQGDFVLQQDDSVKQRLDRCQGQLWTYVWNEDAFKDRFFFAYRMSGRVIFWLSRLLHLCGLVAVWNDDFTSADLFVEGRPIFSFSYSGMKLLPFWAWKFGLDHEEDASTLQAMDSKCCPPKENGPDCTGGDVLGTPGHPCETISMACGALDRNDILDCAMWRRSGPTFLFFEYTYLIFPIGDKYQQPTHFYPSFEEAMEEKGVRQFFQGHKTEACPQE